MIIDFTKVKSYNELPATQRQKDRITYFENLLGSIDQDVEKLSFSEACKYLQTLVDEANVEFAFGRDYDYWK